MTPERAKALENVAEAAQQFRIVFANPDYLPSQKAAAAGMLFRFLDALDAIPTEPADTGEMVEVRAGVYKNGPGIYRIMGMRFEDGQIVVAESDNLIATITARIPRPVVPEVRAEVVT